MADIDLSIGLDDKAFQNALNKMMNSATKKAAATASQIQTIMGDWSNVPVLSNRFFDKVPKATWQSFPNINYQTYGGSAKAAGALMLGSMTDFKKAGYNSAGIYNAMASASTKFMFNSPEERTAFLKASGLGIAAQMTDKGSEAGRIIEANYALMQQDWAQSFVKKNKAGEVIPDFAKMREYAVATGLGKWTDPKKGHTAENFELISDSLDKINDKTKKTGQGFEGWGTSLKSVLGTLTAIAGIGIIATKLAERDIEKTATSIPNTRTFFGMSPLDVRRTQKAGAVLGIGQNDIYNDIAKLSAQRQLFKNLGEDFGALPASLLNVFRTITDTTDPFEAYKQIAQELVNASNQPGANKELINALMTKMGLGSLNQVVGALMQGGDLSGSYGSVESLFGFGVSNPYREDVLSNAKAVNALIQEQKDSIKTSYSELYQMWEEEFGSKFRGYWDELLKNQIVPWFKRNFSYTEEDKNLYDTNMTAIALEGNLNDFYRKNRKNPGILSLLTAPYLGTDYTPEAISLGTLTKKGRNNIFNVAGVTGEIFAGYLDALANEKVYKSVTPEARAYMDRAALAKELLTVSGFWGELSDNSNTMIDDMLMAVVRSYMATGNTQDIVNALGKALDVTGAYKLQEEYGRIEGEKMFNFVINITPDGNGGYRYDKPNVTVNSLN